MYKKGRKFKSCHSDQKRRFNRTSFLLYVVSLSGHFCESLGGRLKRPHYAAKAITFQRRYINPSFSSLSHSFYYTNRATDKSVALSLLSLISEKALKTLSFPGFLFCLLRHLPIIRTQYMYHRIKYTYNLCHRQIHNCVLMNQLLFVQR